MKYGRFIYRYTGLYRNGSEALYNIGDNIQTFAIDNLYRECGISTENIVNLNFTELGKYDGDYCIVPMAGYFSSYEEFEQLPVSDKIIPIFLSTELGYKNCRDIVPFLKKWEPIGARDESTLQNFRRNGLRSFLTGCFTITLPRRKVDPKNGKVFLVDLSEDALNMLPERIRKNGEIIHHVGKIKTVPMDECERIRIDNIAKELIERYKNEASLVITSRLHAAAPCIAMGISTIVMCDNVDRRFSWLDKIVPLYDKSCYEKIDWNPKSVDIEDIKRDTVNLFKVILEETRKKYEPFIKAASFWENRERFEYDRVLETQIQKLAERFGKNEKFSYIIWGGGAHGHKAFSMISEKFPNSNLTFVVDKFLTGELFGKRIIKAGELRRDMFDYAIISTSPGRFEAKKKMSELGCTPDVDYCYFISQPSQGVNEVEMVDRIWGGESAAWTYDTESFTLHLNETIFVIYGANNYLKKITNIIQRRGYEVGCIVDRRADELGFIDGIPVLSEENIKEFASDSRMLVYILLQNAMQHDEIANRLAMYGFKKIIYVPMADIPGNKKASLLRINYNKIFLDEFTFNIITPYFDKRIYPAGFLDNDRKEYIHSPYIIQNKIFLQSSDCNNSLINRSKYVTVRIPSEIVYTNPEWIIGMRQNILKYADIPLTKYRPYVELMKWLFGKKADLSEYLADYGINSCKYDTNYDNVQILERRKKLYNLWEPHFKAKDEFFVDSAPLAEYNENGYFNLLEGQHRSLYLIMKGEKRIPLRILKRDMEKWQTYA